MGTSHHERSHSYLELLRVINVLQEEQLGVSLLTREQLLSREVQQRLQGKLTRLLPLPAPFGSTDPSAAIASERAIVLRPEMQSDAEEQLEDEEADELMAESAVELDAPPSVATQPPAPIAAASLQLSSAERELERREGATREKQIRLEPTRAESLRPPAGRELLAASGLKAAITPPAASSSTSSSVPQPPPRASTAAVSLDSRSSIKLSIKLPTRPK